ncbi:MAG: paraquat-inducible protein A [Verrucomicrobiales bacterium]|jgi:paraquat-inducible protein A
MRIRTYRAAAFFCIIGLITLVPAYFLPAFLMTNSVDGSRWFSIWSGIQKFYESGDYFLGTLIFVFSIIFPIAKLLLTFVCCISRGFFGDKLSQRLVKIAGYSAKYSMLDVLVVAMLIVVIKVDEYIQLIPTVGIYLFSVAIGCSILANWFFPDPTKEGNRVEPRSKLTMLTAGIVFLLATGAIIFAISSLVGQRGGEVKSLHVTNLNARAIPRTIERMKLLKEVYDERDSWIPDKNLLGQIAKTLQAATTDLDVIEPEMLLEITTVDGEVIRTEPLKMDFDETIDEFWVIDSEQPDPLVLADIRSIKMLSRVTYNRWLGTDNEEELLTVADDPYRKITRTWFGRVFKFSFEGQRSTVLLWWLLIPSLLVTAAALSVLLVHRMTAKQ